MGFDGDVIVEVQFGVEIRPPPFINIMRRARELQSAKVELAKDHTPKSAFDLYTVVSTKAEMAQLVDALDPDDVLLTGVPGICAPVLPDQDELARWDDDIVDDTCNGGDLESGVRELVCFRSDELDDVLDDLLPPDHRLCFLWDSAGDDDVYMRLVVKDAKVQGCRSVRGWKYADSWGNYIEVFKLHKMDDALKYSKRAKVDLGTLPSLSVEEEAQARSDIAKVVRLFGLQVVEAPAWSVMVKEYGG